MNAALYRRIKITVAALTLGFCALAFADIGNWVSAPVARAAFWPQFIPSLLNTLNGFAWISAGCIAVIILTLLLGRVYCAMLCPLGVLMDFSAWLARRTGKRRKLPYRPGRTWLRIPVVLTCTIGLLVGTTLPIALLDPYSLFGKITAATLRPLLGTINHWIAATGAIHPVDVSPVAWTSAFIAFGLLAPVIITAVFRGRLWCNTLCPVGAVLGFFSKYALFRLKIANSACVACSMCERVCPAQCIDFKNHKIDHSRCIMCLDCVTSCKRSGISLRCCLKIGRDAFPTRPRDRKENEKSAFDRVILIPITRTFRKKVPASIIFSQPLSRNPSKISPAIHPKTNPETNSLPSTNRRLFLTSVLTLPAAALASTANSRNSPVELTQHNKRAVLPPGAQSLAHFQSRCTACHLCVTNCPDQVLRPSITQHGLAGFLQPYQDFTVAFCSYNCSNCSQICPTGAIRPITIEERRLVRTGTAEFFEDRCVVKTKGTSCGACSEHCPTQAVHMVPWKNGITIPEIEPDLCIGCGGCEFICPVRPDKAIIVNGLAIHERAKKIILGQENTIRKIEVEFPF
jgi:polyferredoxin